MGKVIIIGQKSTLIFTKENINKEGFNKLINESRWLNITHIDKIKEWKGDQQNIVKN